MEYFPVVLMSVGKVLTSVVAAAVTSRGIPAVGNTIKDLSFVVTNVTVPCLFMTRMAASVTLELLSSCSVLLVFSFLGSIIGYTLGYLFAAWFFPYGQHLKAIAAAHRKLVAEAPPGEKPSLLEAMQLARTIPAPHDDEEVHHAYSYLLILGCSFQNTVIIPLSLLISMRQSDELKWIRFDDGLAYIFVYNIAVTVVFWSGGALLMRTASHQQKAFRRLNFSLRAHQKLQLCVDVACGNDAPLVKGKMAGKRPEGLPPLSLPHRGHSTTEEDRKELLAAGEEESPQSMVVQEHTDETHAVHLQRYIAHVIAEGTNSLFSAADVTGTSNNGGSVEGKRNGSDDDSSGSAPSYFIIGQPGKLWNDLCESNHFVLQILRSFANAPFMAMCLGVSIGLIPPLRELFLNGPGRILYDAMFILGDGTVPCALLLLGANLSTPSTNRMQKATVISTANAGTEPISEEEFAQGSTCCPTPTATNGGSQTTAPLGGISLTSLNDSSSRSQVSIVCVDTACGGGVNPARSLSGGGSSTTGAAELQRAQMKLHNTSLTESNHSYTSKVACQALKSSFASEHYSRLIEDEAESALIANQGGIMDLQFTMVGDGDSASSIDGSPTAQNATQSLPQMNGSPATSATTGASGSNPAGSASTTSPPLPMVCLVATPGDQESEDGDISITDPERTVSYCDVDDHEHRQNAQNEPPVANEPPSPTVRLSNMPDAKPSLSLRQRFHASTKTASAIFALNGISPKFVWGVPFVRLFIVPLVSLTLIHLTVKQTAAGQNPTLMLILLLEICAPTAINTALMTNLYNFHVFEYAKMLVYQYGCCVVTSVCWLSFGLWYITA